MNRHGLFLMERRTGCLWFHLLGSGVVRKQQPAFCGQIVHRFYLLGGLTLDGFDQALVKPGR